MRAIWMPAATAALAAGAALAGPPDVCPRPLPRPATLGSATLGPATLGLSAPNRSSPAATALAPSTSVAAPPRVVVPAEVLLEAALAAGSAAGAAARPPGAATGPESVALPAPTAAAPAPAGTRPMPRPGGGPWVGPGVPGGVSPGGVAMSGLARGGAPPGGAPAASGAGGQAGRDDAGGAAAGAPVAAADMVAGRGWVCGKRAIRGQVLDPIGSATRGCGIDDPVQVTEVAGVPLSTAITVDCPTAKALDAWVERGLKPAVGRKGGGLDEVTILASYACRSRNNIPGGKLSEHASGHAVDIGGFVLKDGTEVTVLDDWGGRKYGKSLRKAHAAACGPFGTVLGPKADRYHRNHFHLDTASYRSGPFCQ